MKIHCTCCEKKFNIDNLYNDKTIICPHCNVLTNIQKPKKIKVLKKIIIWSIITYIIISFSCLGWAVSGSSDYFHMYKSSDSNNDNVAFLDFEDNIIFIRIPFVFWLNWYCVPNYDHIAVYFLISGNIDYPVISDIQKKDIINITLLTMDYFSLKKGKINLLEKMTNNELTRTGELSNDKYFKPILIPFNKNLICEGDKIYISGLVHTRDGQNINFFEEYYISFSKGHLLIGTGWDTYDY